MKRQTIIASFATAFTAMVLIFPAYAARPTPAVTMTPKTIRVGATGVLKGTNFHAGEYWFFLIAVPNLKKPKAMRFVAETRPAKNGTVSTQAKIPLEPFCGRAGIYAYSTTSQKKAIWVGSVTLTGCKAGGNPGPPPKP
jgi:hypothetical protein